MARRKRPSGLQDDAAVLLSILKDCSPDMHEPDNQGVSAQIIGHNLDNCFGVCAENFDMKRMLRNIEMVLIIQKHNWKSNKTRREVFNLCNILALAREGAQAQIDARKSANGGGKEKK